VIWSLDNAVVVSNRFEFVVVALAVLFVNDKAKMANVKIDFFMISNF
jgi:hypothetical protein